MKKSLLTCLVIFGIGAVLCFLQKRNSSLAEIHYQQLVETANQLGISPSPIGVKTTKLQRELQKKQVESAITLATELAAAARDHGRSSREYLQLSEKFEDMLTTMDESQVSSVFSELGGKLLISSKELRLLLAATLMQRAKTAPESALALICELSELLAEGEMRSEVIQESLQNLAASQLPAALTWLAQNSARLPELATDKIACEVIHGAAKSDPSTAFRLIAELQLKDPIAAVRTIIEAGTGSAEARTSALSALRAHLTTLDDPVASEEIGKVAMETFAENCAAQGVAKMTDWMAKSKFTAEEKIQFAGGLSYFTAGQDTGRWVDWLATNLPAGEVAKPVDELVGEWAQQDYHRAGSWLAAAAESPAKQAAVHAYAEAVAEYEPKVAEQWAMTLPAGLLKDETLRVIYRNWPSNDPQGASAFADAHRMN